jgi:ABC-type glycerol-3-phosphate transport system permease component
MMASRQSMRHFATYLVVVPACIIIALPLVWLLIASFKSSEDFFTSAFMPKGEGFLGIAWERLTLENFRKLFDRAGFARALLSSVLLSSVTATLATLVCAAAGYALARLAFKGKRAMTWFVLACLVVPGPLLLAPGFALLFNLGLLDTLAGLVLPAIAPAFGVYLFRQSTIASVPPELLEAARIDGFGELRIFWRVALPLLRPMIAAFMLITFLGMWNNFINPQVVLQSSHKFPLAVMISQLKDAYSQDYGLMMAGTIASIVPVALLFLFMQRDFVAGLTSGAVKG